MGNIITYVFSLIALLVLQIFSDFNESQITPGTIFCAALFIVIGVSNGVNALSNSSNSS